MCRGKTVLAILLPVILFLVVVPVLLGPPALAQSSPRPGAGGPDRGSSRLFQRFVEDAGIVPGGWIEARYSYENLPEGRQHTLGPVVAFRLGDDVEAGLRFGFLDVSGREGPDGSGLSDIDLYGKYRLEGRSPQFALGALLKVATAEEEEGLGTGANDVELFGAYRAELAAVTLVANAGVRFNGDTDPPLAPTKDSLLLGGGILLPAAPAATFSIEASYETRRLQGDHADGRLTIGIQTLGPTDRGGFRAALGIPLTDGAPDLQLIVAGYLVY